MPMCAYVLYLNGITYHRSVVVCFFICNHCLSLDFFFFFLSHQDVSHCAIVFKNRMIVSWTIKGSDMFGRFPQSRIISAEFAPSK